MKKFFKEFKEFALKGNVLDLAIGVIIGGAFSGIVTSLTDNFINPILQYVLGFLPTGEGADLPQILVNVANFITAVINFIIIALVLFLIVKSVNKMMVIGKKKDEEPAAPTTKQCPYCMSEIAINATRCPHCTSVIEETNTEG